jgi:hypothetical protein
VLFLTDGEVTEGRRGDELLEFIASINGPDDDVRIFTYALGDEASPSTLRQIACRNKGIFAHVPDGGDLRAKMSQYYSYFAAGLVRRELVAWAEPFTECCGMGVVTTASQACYIPDTERRGCWLWPPRQSRSVEFRRLCSASCSIGAARACRFR